MLRNRCLLGLVFGLLFAGVAQGEGLRFVTADWPPFTMMEANGQPSGLDVELVQEFSRRAKIEAEIHVVPWKRAQIEVEQGLADAIFTLKKTEAREKFLAYPGVPLERERVSIYSLKGKGFKAQTLLNLKDMQIGVVRGNVYSKEFDSADFLWKDESVNDEMMMRKLAHGRFDLVIGEEISLHYLAGKLGIDLEPVYFIGEYPTYIAFSNKTTAGSDAFSKCFDFIMHQMVQDGTVKRIRDKYAKKL